MILEKRSLSRNIGDRWGKDKYFIQFSQQYFANNPDEAFILEYVDLQQLQNLQSGVLKIGSNETITKEWEISRKLSTIHGFITYTMIKSNGENSILVMPHFNNGSICDYKWVNNIQQLKSCLKQIVCSMLIAFKQFGFVHSKLHIGNVLVKDTTEQNIVYPEIGIEFPSNGIQICIMDFYHACIGAKKDDTKFLFIDLHYIIQDLVYTLKLEFEGIDKIFKITSNGMFNNGVAIESLLQLIVLIDDLKFLGTTQLTFVS